jgi:hypothetical protein
MSYILKSEYKLESDWLPSSEFFRTFEHRSEAVATAIEGVDDPAGQQVLVVDVETGEIVWDSTLEKYEENSES